ncbi:MAG: Wzz/FepE/Etk N-terminal domain-containing protein [Candidatus Eisenbacteria bacterium]
MTWIDRLLALTRWKRLIVINTLVVAVLSVGYALLLDNWYRSTATIFPPEEESFSLGSLSSLLAVSALGAGRTAVPVWASPSDVYASVLRSRVVMEAIIERFGLQEIYELETLDETIEEFQTHFGVHVAGDGMVFILVDDKDPQRAADMANAFVEELDEVNRTKRHTAAGQARIFLERRIAEANVDLAAAEEHVRELQVETGLLDPEEQVKGAVRALTELETQLILKEVELQVLETRVGPRHPERESLAREVVELKRKLAELEDGPPEATSEERIALRELPDLALDHFRALREVKVQEAIFEFLRQQYEQFRIQEQRDTPTIYVLDPARPAERKHHPRRSILCISATLVAFTLSVGFALAAEGLARMRALEPGRFERVQLLAGEVGLGWLVKRVPER